MGSREAVRRRWRRVRGSSLVSPHEVLYPSKTLWRSPRVRSRRYGEAQGRARGVVVYDILASLLGSSWTRAFYFHTDMDMDGLLYLSWFAVHSL